MSILAWIFIGTIAGLFASKLVNKQGEGLLVDAGLGIAGAVVGGGLYSTFGEFTARGFNPWSLLMAIAVAAGTLMAYHLVLRRA